MHYYQFNIGDYTSHTRGLSLLEDLAYRRLIDEYFLTERPFNECSTTVARIIGFVEHADVVAYVLVRFFRKDGGKWVHDRIEKDLEAYRRKSAGAAKAGKASAQVRRNKGESNERSTNVERTLTERTTNVQPTNNQEPITKKKKRDAPPADRGHRLPADFCVPVDWLAWAKAERPDVDANAESMKFCDYWRSQPGAKGRKSDWLATWRNWIRNSKGGIGASQQPMGKTMSAIQALEDRKNEIRRQMDGAGNPGGASTPRLLEP